MTPTLLRSVLVMVTVFSPSTLHLPPLGATPAHGLFPTYSYRGVHSEVGDSIDWYHVQFYNQEECDYTTYDRLFGGNLSCKWGDSTVLDIVEHGVTADKLVVAKPATQGDLQGSGLITGRELAAAVLQACEWWGAGLAVWQYSSDRDGDFIAASSVGCLYIPPPSPPSRASTLPTSPSTTLTPINIAAAASSLVILMLCCVSNQLRRTLRNRKIHSALEKVAGTARPWRQSIGKQRRRPVFATSCDEPSDDGALQAYVDAMPSKRRRSSIESLQSAVESLELCRQSRSTSSEVELRDLVLHGRSGSGDIIEGLGDPDAHPGFDIDQRRLVRYSRLLVRDAKQWLDEPETAHLAFSPVKQMGFVKLLAVVTMYAETPALLDRTLRGLARSVQQLSADTDFLRSWEEAVVCIVADGIEKLPSDTAEWLERMGVYCPRLVERAAELGAGSEGRDPDVALHCFEGLMHFDGMCPLQIVLIVKQANAGKLDSQRWAFVGIAERLFPTMPSECQPECQPTGLCGVAGLCGGRTPTLEELRSMDRYLVTVDAGTEPQPNSIMELIQPMRYDMGLAGTCGTMLPDLPGCSSKNPIVMSQVFEYEIGHILDKSMESMFGFITVLPGAFSAYRYDAVRRHQWTVCEYLKIGPLVEYFRPLERCVTSPALLNMGLAEDRILCFNLVSMGDRAYSLRYCKNAKAVTDVPDSLDSLIKQRRRWNNGAFFAKLYALQNFQRIIYGTNHSGIARATFLFQAFLMAVEVTVGWFGIALFYMLSTFAFQQFQESMAGAVLSHVVQIAIIGCVMLQIIAYHDSTGPLVRRAHLMISWVYGFCFLCSVNLFLVGQVLGKPDLLTAFVAVPVGSIFISSLMHNRFLAILSVAPAYFALLPTYMVLFQLHAFCHIHDVSWGTKGISTVHGNTEDKESTMVRLSSFRFQVVFGLVFTNTAAVVTVRHFALHTHILLPFMSTIVVVYAVRLIGSIAHVVTARMQALLDPAPLSPASYDLGEKRGDLLAALARASAEDLRGCFQRVEAMQARIWALEAAPAFKDEASSLAAPAVSDVASSLARSADWKDTSSLSDAGCHV